MYCTCDNKKKKNGALSHAGAPKTA